MSLIVYQVGDITTLRIILSKFNSILAIRPYRGTYHRKSTFSSLTLSINISILK